MNDDRRLWNDEALEAEERARQRKGAFAIVRRLPPRLVSAAIAGLICGVIVAVVELAPDAGLVTVFTLSAAFAGGAYVNFALRRPTTVVVAAAGTAYLLSFVVLVVLGIALTHGEDAARITRDTIGLSVYFLPWILAGIFLWAAAVRAGEQRLFSNTSRDAARRGGRFDVATTLAWTIGAVVWAAIVLGVLSTTVQ